jgi:hypothetical protein
MFLDDETVKKYSIRELKRITKNNIVPHNKRMAAIRLYELREKDFAINFLIEQMSLYAKPGTPYQTINETCVNTAIALGRINDKRAITPLFNALGELPFFGASYALGLMNGSEITTELVKLATLESRKGIHAIIALGFMKHERALPFLIEIIEHQQEFEKNYQKDSSTQLLTHFAFKILGLYDNGAAKNLFLSNLTKDRMAFLLSDYVHFERFPHAYTVGNEVGWHIAKKYGWDKYVKSDDQQFAFLFTHISHWATYCKTTCPFKSQDEVDALREDIKNKIWQELGKTQTK